MQPCHSIEPFVKMMFILKLCILLYGCVVVGAYYCPPNAPLVIGTGHLERCISTQDCLRRSFVVYGKTCVHSCPPGTGYQQDTSTCYNTCPAHTIMVGSRCLNGTYCVSHNNQVLFNGTCAPSCPSSMPFKTNGTCYQACPVDTVMNGSDCMSQSDCMERGYFIDNTTCVKVCPPNKQSILQGVCHSSCPPDKSVTVNGNQCLSKQECTGKLGQFIYNNTCVPVCPAAAMFSDQGSCTALCPTGKCVLGTECIYAFDRRNMVSFRNECIATCPAEAPYAVDSICYSTCPPNTVLNDEACIGLQQCLDAYGLYKVIFNNTCVDACPQAAPLNHYGTCVTICPDETVIADMQCVYTSMCLDNSRFIFNRTCVSDCPNAVPYIANGLCQPACPEDFVVTAPEKFQCIGESECIKMKKMVSDGTCATACPKESPYIRSSHCYQTCPQETVALPDMNCVSYQECKGQGMFVHESKCLHECPSTFKYKLHNTCILECPSNTSVFPDNKCVSISDCSTITDAVKYNGSCLPHCPPHVPYKHSGNCQSQCPSGFFAKGFDCLDNYQCKNVLYNGSCFSSCPQEAPNRKDSNCYAICPSDTYIYQEKCIYQYDCQEKMFYIAGGSCVSTCPPGSAGFTDYVCHPLINVYGPITVTPFLMLMVLMCLFFMVYNPKRSREMNAPQKPQREHLTCGECDMLEYVTFDNITRQQQDNAELPEEENMDVSSDEELLPMQEQRNAAIQNATALSHNGDILGFANCFNNVIIHPRRDHDDVPLLQATSEDEPLIQHNGDSFLFGDGLN
ncbi:proprotein convertase subtilisin/kexin type 5-like [Haliotis rufescens]|uniref:proprotein convertase subtilisin/kexin type 5-like n=1 Tax=Haliotis rufescens TaxID=6454 RepID=UPI00201E7F14|nr:proprotein convertase subtilisin/kexin type 5-like [Haliotis rufescens]